MDEVESGACGAAKVGEGGVHTYDGIVDLGPEHVDGHARAPCIGRRERDWP